MALLFGERWLSTKLYSQAGAAAVRAVIPPVACNRVLLTM